jgi:hypothetical protein
MRWKSLVLMVSCSFVIFELMKSLAKVLDPIG